MKVTAQCEFVVYGSAKNKHITDLFANQPIRKHIVAEVKVVQKQLKQSAKKKAQPLRWNKILHFCCLFDT